MSYRADYQSNPDPNGEWILPQWMQVETRHGKLYFFCVNLLAMAMVLVSVIALVLYVKSITL